MLVYEGRYVVDCCVDDADTYIRKGEILIMRGTNMYMPLSGLFFAATSSLVNVLDMLAVVGRVLNYEGSVGRWV